MSYIHYGRTEAELYQMGVCQSCGGYGFRQNDDNIFDCLKCGGTGKSNADRDAGDEARAALKVTAND